VDRSHIQTFIGIDLGGARGKSTALAKLTRTDAGAQVDAVHGRCPGDRPWEDDALLEYLAACDADSTAVGVNAPLTAPACVRCELSVCPGYAECVDPATHWLRDEGQKLLEQAVLADGDRIVAVPEGSGFTSAESLVPAAARQRLPPYTHRCTEVVLHFSRGLLPREKLGQMSWAIAARAAHLRRALARLGFHLNESLLEVSPRCTVQARFGEAKARGYKRDADPWRTRASIVEDLGEELCFSRFSGLSREEVLRNDDCFDALLSAFTVSRWAHEGWTMPQGEPFAEDGWIWAPPG
jgi:hypothetical protein